MIIRFRMSTVPDHAGAPAKAHFKRQPGVGEGPPAPAGANGARRPKTLWARWLAVAGPGILVMLADTDAGSIITAAQSGAQWGYRLLLAQLLLVPVLYLCQELTVRLGV